MKKWIVLSLAMIGMMSCKNLNTQKKDNPYTVVTSARLHGNGQEGFKADEVVVVKTQAQWDNLLKKLSAVNPVEEDLQKQKIDFNQYMAIALFYKNVGTSGYQFSVKEINETDNQILITTTAKAPEMGAMVMNQPYQIITMKKSDKTVKLNK